jgi:hypothetical protein
MSAELPLVQALPPPPTQQQQVQVQQVNHHPAHLSNAAAKLSLGFYSLLTIIHL